MQLWSLFFVGRMSPRAFPTKKFTHPTLTLGIWLDYSMHIAIYCYYLHFTAASCCFAPASQQSNPLKGMPTVSRLPWGSLPEPEL